MPLNFCRPKFLSLRADFFLADKVINLIINGMIFPEGGRKEAETKIEV